MKLKYTTGYLLLIGEEAEIKAGSYYITNLGNIYKETERFFEEDEGVERFTNRSVYKPILAYYPLTKEAKKLDLPLLPNPFEENIEILWADFNKNNNINCPISKEQFVRAINYKAAQSKQFSLEDMKKAIEMARIGQGGLVSFNDFIKPDYTEEEIIQSLSTQQLPSEFIPEWTQTPPAIFRENDVPYAILKTITNSEDKKEIVGRYIW